MKITALLPMKGHSERVPSKNLRAFNGSPLFLHVLKTLDGCSSIDEIIINTDSEEIADLAKNNSAKVKIHIRPEEIRGDFVSMNKVIEHDINHSDADVYLQTHSTNPLLRTATLEEALKRFKERQSDIDSIFSVTRLQTRLYWEDGKAVNHNPEELLRTQDLPPIYEENSNFFIFTKDSFSASGGKRIGVKPEMFEVDKIEAMDIDDMNDFIIAEALHKLNLFD